MSRLQKAILIQTLLTLVVTWVLVPFSYQMGGFFLGWVTTLIIVVIHCAFSLMIYRRGNK